MSISYQSKDDKVLSVALKVQELCLVVKDPVVAVSGADLLISIGEPVDEVRSAMIVDSTGAVAGVAQADLVIIDSVDPLLVGNAGDRKRVKVVGTSLAAGDALTMKYVIRE
jgi:hypothetical protein